jgi:hypothetical protein
VVAQPADGTLDGVSDDRLTRLVDLALVHRVMGSVTVALRAAGRDLPSDLAHANDAAMINHLQSLAALGRISSCLDRAGIPWLVVKGPVIAARWADAGAPRSYGDLDLLVSPQHLGEAIEHLRSIGYEHRNRNWEGFRRLGVGEVPLDDGNVVIDLHWSLLGLDVHRRAFHLPTNALIDRSVLIDLGRAQARTLDPTDTFIHLGVHHGLAGARLLVQLRDVQLVAPNAEDEVVQERLQEARAGRLVSGVLDRARRAFAPSNGATSRTLAGRPWPTLNRLVDRVAAVARPGAPYPGALVAAGRSEPVATAQALAGTLATWARTRIGATTETSDGGPLDWRVDAGGAAEYRRFLDDVAAGRYGS